MINKILSIIGCIILYCITLYATYVEQGIQMVAGMIAFTIFISVYMFMKSHPKVFCEEI